MNMTAIFTFLVTSVVLFLVKSTVAHNYISMAFKRRHGYVPSRNVLKQNVVRDTYGQVISRKFSADVATVALARGFYHRMSMTDMTLIMTSILASAGVSFAMFH